MSERLNRELMVLVFVAAGLLLLPGCRGTVNPAARRTFLNDLGQTSITVYPAYVRQRQEWHDDTSAERLAEFLRDEKLAKVQVTDARVPITGPWGEDQSEMLRESAESFAADVQDYPIRTDYALLAEYLFGPDAAVGIHCYVVDAQGRVAYAVLLNDHHAPFARAAPYTVRACTDVLIEVLRDGWRVSG